MKRENTKEIILARPGTYGGRDNPKNVTSQDLKEIAESFKSGEVIPITVTQEAHPESGNFPKFGEVVNVRWEESTQELYGTIKLSPELEKAMNEGYYDNWSIGAKIGADGKMYLHHLAFLGETPPAIKNLRKEIMQSLNMADDIITPCFSRMERIQANKIKEWERNHLKESMEGKFPYARQGMVLELADQLAGHTLNLSDEEGKTSLGSVYTALSAIFDIIPYPVKEGIYLKDENDDFDRPIKKILNKA